MTWRHAAIGGAAFIAAAASIVLVTGPDVATVGRIRVRCSDFDSQSSAQAAVQAYPYLDRDGDGVACEELR